MQIAALSVIVIILIEYYQYKRIGLMSNKLFAGFLCLAAVNVLTELLTLYTIWHIDTVGSAFNRFSHQLFIGSMDATILCLFLYVDVKSRRQKRYSEKEIFYRLIPAIFSLIVILFGRLDYRMGEEVRYSYGPMAMTVYVSVAIYLFWTLRVINTTEGVFDVREKWNMRVGIWVWLLMAVIQFIAPETLLSSVGMVMMVVFLYIAFEDPQAFQDAELKDVMNEHAFLEAVTALLEMRSPFHIVQITVPDLDEMLQVNGEEQVRNMLAETAQKLCLDRKQCVYHTSEFSMCMLYDREKRYRRGMEKLEALLGSGQSSFCFQIIKAPELGHTTDELEKVLDFTRENCTSVRKDILVVDVTLLDEMFRKEAVENLVVKAIAEEGLEVYYQPIYSTKEKCFLSAEALVRLKDTTTLGYISPEIFVPIAEKMGLVDKLGSQVFEMVCRFAAREKIWNYGVEYLEVNLSGIQACDPNLPQKLMECADKYGIRPDFINLEITETAAIESGEQVMKNMMALKELGFQFSMDDFGTGYSNLSKMAESSFDLVKLDKSLIWPCFGENKEKPEVILEASIMMIHQLGLKIVAEGVETKEQQTFLEERGVEYLQGYLFSRPVSADRYIEFLHVEHVRSMMNE